MKIRYKKDKVSKKLKDKNFVLKNLKERVKTNLFIKLKRKKLEFYLYI
jgi:hypothetical protein